MTQIVYVLLSQKDNKRYIGFSDDVARRLEEHNRGYSKATRGRGPFKIVHTEEYPTRKEARKREKFLKSGQGRKFLDEILQ